MLRNLTETVKFQLELVANARQFDEISKRNWGATQCQVNTQQEFSGTNISNLLYEFHSHEPTENDDRFNKKIN